MPRADRLPAPASGPQARCDRPAANDNHPFRLLALAHVRVDFGVMERERLQSADDLIIGDWLRFRADLTTSPAETLDEGCCSSVRLAGQVDVGLSYFVIGAAHDLILMSQHGAMLPCRHISNRDRAGQNYLLLPQGFDVAQTYELIEKSAVCC